VSNCGSCGAACDAGTCTSGTCCGVSQTICGTSCTNLQTDSNNCGTCGAVCGGGASCNSGSCCSSCPGSCYVTNGSGGSPPSVTLGCSSTSSASVLTCQSGSTACPNNEECLIAANSNTAVRYSYDGYVCDPTTASDGSSNAGDSGSTCNDLTNAAPVITAVTVLATAPPYTGGSITPGTYWLTSLSTYVGPDGGYGITGSYQGTAVVSAGSSPSSGTINSVELSEGNSVAFTYTYTTDGYTMYSFPSCGTTSDDAYAYWYQGGTPAYTATSTEIDFYWDVATVLVWTLQ
jgi:hypothetical protein